MLVSDKHSSLLDQFISYEESIVNMVPGAVFNKFVFFITYDDPNKLE
jgi:hypothetical protein